MKRILPLCLVVFILLGYMFPVQPVKADQGTEVTYTDTQLSQLGVWALSSGLIQGTIDELDFSNVQPNTGLTTDDLLIAIGRSLVEGSPFPLIDFGLQIPSDLANDIDALLQEIWQGARDFAYELWYGPQGELHPVDSFNRAWLNRDYLKDFSNLIKSPGDGDEIYIPEDYLWFQNVNQLYFHNTDFLNCSFSYWSDPVVSPLNPISNYTFYINGSNHTSSYGHLPNSYDGIVDIYMCGYLPKLSFYFDSSSNSLEVSSSNRSNPFYSSRSLIRYFHYYNGGNEQPLIYIQNQSDWSFDIQSTFASLDVCLNYIYSHFYNINFYVDGQLWVGGNPPSSPIGSGELTYPNGQPAIREFPSDTYIDFDELYDRILQAITDGLVINFTDIDDCIVDVNGQPAVATLGLVRTDYDNMYSEQYGNSIVYFPTTLSTGEAQAVVGGTVGNIISPYNPSNPALNEDSVIPSDIARVLYIGVFLTLFACIINRLLE